MKWILFFLLSLSYKKIVLCKSIETQEISGFASRQSRGVGGSGEGAKGGIHSHSSSS